MAASSASLDVSSFCHISLSQVATIRLRCTVKAKSPRGSSASVGIAVVALVAQEGQLVFVEGPALGLAGQGQQRTRLADQVERHVGQRNVFFEDGPWPHHSPRRWPRIRQVSARRSRYCSWGAAGIS
jgi:hypothetical protein